MRGFSQALGVRCSYCHDGQEGQPLSSYDFASDANPNKDRARAMYRLLGAVNDHLDEIEPSAARVNMWCHTCHSGRPRPQTLGEAIQERYQAEGGEASFQYFIELRNQYFGSAAYDFTASAVDEVAESLLAQDDTLTAIRFTEHNLAVFPNDWQALERMADVWLERGQADLAVAYYRRSLEALPDNPRAAAKLRRLQGA